MSIIVSYQLGHFTKEGNNTQLQMENVQSRVSKLRFIHMKGCHYNGLNCINEPVESKHTLATGIALGGEY